MKMTKEAADKYALALALAVRGIDPAKPRAKQAMDKVAAEPLTTAVIAAALLRGGKAAARTVSTSALAAMQAALRTALLAPLWAPAIGAMGGYGLGRTITYLNAPTKEELEAKKKRELLEGYVGEIAKIHAQSRENRLRSPDLSVPPKIDLFG